ncbi:MAG: hypothetical protein DI535_14850 [Citrobacter freundii]|nr:MAG: hypothetical protein DI535_14850 [Citrobacter freundii]
MKQLLTIAFGLMILTRISFAQAVNPDCSGFNATYTTKESRCASTGSITITPSGGSGNYSYRILSPISLPITSTSTITGLAPGNYTVQTKDMTTGCTLVQGNIIVAGSYNDPRFSLEKTDLTCIGSQNGSIAVTDLQNGRSPFTYKIIAPSPTGVGISNSTGIFNSISAGEYYIQLLDSCGGIQTRSVAIQDYNWSISGNTVTKTSCNTIYVSLILTDNKGNNNLTGSAFFGFKYGVVNAPGDTIWNTSNTFSYTRSPLRTIMLVVKDRCDIVKSVSWKNPQPTVDADVAASNLLCSTFDVRITNAQNFSAGSQATLKQGTSTVQTNTTGIFTNIPYGSYCIEMKDPCYDTIVKRCFVQTKPVPVVNAFVDTSNTQCSTFDVSIGGQVNLFNAVYKLYNSANTLIASNSTGIFSNINYGSYCLRVISVNPCYDTTISRCFTVNKPKPVVPIPVYTYLNCSSYTADITGQQNLFNATYCLYQNNVLVTCNTTGSFPGLSYSTDYCIKITSANPCYDTTIQHCFNRPKPIPVASDPVISNKTCSTFTVRIESTANIPSPKFCLYNSSDALMSCNTTGQFDNVPFGNNYYIQVVSTSTTTDCPINPLKKTFSVSRTMPVVGSTMVISNKTCSTFTVFLSNMNMINSRFCLYDNANNLIGCQNGSTFNNLPYGSYKMVATTSCLDTFIRTFTEAPTPTAFTLKATESCTINATDVKVTVTAGIAPFQLKVLNPLNAVVGTHSMGITNYTFTGLAALPPSLQYRVVVTSACGKTDTLAITPKISQFSRTNTVIMKCPNALSGNGSADISVDLMSNIGLNAPRIIKRDGATVSIAPATITTLTSTSNKYKFLDMTPATYILEYNISSCSKKIYDTINVVPYTFPDLTNSAAYQCDNTNFSVNAVASGGVSPFKYEIIGSNPVGPSIVSPAQASSVFNILTGSAYSLVRMRAIDACGNGTLNDVSVLPLGQLTIRVNNVDCYSNNLTLSVDTVPNATYIWYLKKKSTSTDSTQVTTGQAYNIPYLLPTDTGIYVCKTLVNGGCLQRLSYFNLKGDCSIILPVKITDFKGILSGNDAILNWTVAQEDNIKEYQVERSAGNGSFQYVGSITATNDPARNKYTFTDHNAPGGKIKYRLKIVEQNNGQSYSKTIELTHNAIFITAAPNPVKQELSISISAKTDAAYSIRLFNLSGQVIHQQTTNRIRSGVFRIQRNGKMPSGFYLVKVLNMDSGEEFTEKLIFE